MNVWRSMEGLEGRATRAWLHDYPIASPKPSLSLYKPRWCVVHKMWKNDFDVIEHNSGKLSLFFSGLDLRNFHNHLRGPGPRRPRFARVLQVNWLNGVDAQVGAIFPLVDI